MSSKKLSTLTIFIFLLIILTACLPNTGGGEVEQVPTMPPTATTAPSLPTEPPPPTATPVPTAVPTLEKIPAPAASPAASATPPAPIADPCQRPNGWVDYIIQRGDTLSTLARRTGSTVQEIKTVNCLTSDVIYYGQILFLPTNPGVVQQRPTDIVVTTGPARPGPTITSEIIPVITPTAPLPPPPEESPVAVDPTVELPPAGGPGEPNLYISPSSGFIPTTYTAFLEGFDVNGLVLIKIVHNDAPNTPVLTSSLRVNSLGEGTFSFVSEVGDPPGLYTLIATSEDGSPRLFAQFQVNS